MLERIEGLDPFSLAEELGIKLPDGDYSFEEILLSIPERFPGHRHPSRRAGSKDCS